MRRGFWLHMLVPIALGVWLALWLLSGDRRPEAGDDFLMSAVIHEQETADPQIRFIELRFGGERGTVLFSGDSQIVMTQWLLAHRGERVSVELRGRE